MMNFIPGTTVGLALLVGAVPGGDHELTEIQKKEITTAFEHCMTADVEAEWKALTDRKCAGEKAQCEETGECGLECNCSPSGELFAYHLKANPAGWTVVKPLMVERFTQKKVTEAEQHRVLDLLAWTGGQEVAVNVAEGLHKKDADAFSRDHILAFAEAGSEALAYEAGARAKEDVRCAALMVMRGGHYASKALPKACKEKLATDTAVIDAYVAAAALKKAGKKEHWSRLQERVHDEVINALDEGAIDRARDLALGAEFCVEALSKGKGYGLSYLDTRLAFHRSVRSGEVTSPDHVFNLIERVSPQ